MKLSVSMWSVVSVVKAGKMDLPGFVEFAARQQVNGAQGVELLDYFWRDRTAELPKVKKQVADAGLALAVYSIGNDFFQPDREAWARQQAANVLWLPSLQAGMNYYHHDGLLQQARSNVFDVSRTSINPGFGTRAIGTGVPAVPGVFARFAVSDAIHRPEIAAWQTDARSHASDATRNQVLLDTALAYLNLLEAYQRKAIAQESLANARELANLTRSFAETGQGLQADADRAATELTVRQNAVEQAQEAVGVASARLAQQLSIDPSREILPAEPVLIPLDLISCEQTPHELVALGLRTRPELAENCALVQAAAKELERVRQAPLLPSVLLGMSYGGFGGGQGEALEEPDLGIALHAHGP